MKRPRYRVSEGSTSGHCCFEASIIDTKAGNGSICECVERKDAERITEILNIDEDLRTS
jgi:hypothetical protein